MKKPTLEESQIKLRLERDLRDWLAHAAISNRRTIGREIEYRLMQSRDAEQKRREMAVS